MNFTESLVPLVLDPGINEDRSYYYSWLIYPSSEISSKQETVKTFTH